MNLTTPHDFPMPHVDYLEHTITYDVPQDKVGDLVEFDGSSTINRTASRSTSTRCTPPRTPRRRRSARR